MVSGVCNDGEPKAQNEPTPVSRNVPMAASGERIVFVTGKLAEFSLRQDRRTA